MSIRYEQNSVVFEATIYESAVVPLRDYFQQKAGTGSLELDFTNCEDIHLALLQLIMAYKKNYECSYKFGSDKKIFEKMLRGFDISENHCNK